MTILELILRIYNPFGFRMRGDDIYLTAKDKVYSFRLSKPARGLDSRITQRRNSLGLRGKEPPTDFDDHLTLVTVGGSVVECVYQSDRKTWTDMLSKKLDQKFKKVWLNNAGFSGHSTLGHLALMKGLIIPLKPKAVLFLLGANDRFVVDRETARVFKKKTRDVSMRQSLKALSSQSEVLSLCFNLYRYLKTQSFGLQIVELTHDDIRNDRLLLKYPLERIKPQLPQLLNDYEGRLTELVRITREEGIEPIFMTQPFFYGRVLDHEMKVINLYQEEMGEIFELYNAALRKVARQEKNFLIDLARELPKSTRFFYDEVHFTNEGNLEVAEIISKHLVPHLKEKYSSFAA